MDGNSLKIDGKDFENMLALGFCSLAERESEINKLNVFPVPDGDTGSNMRMTYEAGLNALKGADTHSICEVANLFSKGALLGARGNSGVILSQIFKGIAVGLNGKDTADSSDFYTAFLQGVDKSYKAVVKPVEGTMLTVFRESCEGVANSFAASPLNAFFNDLTDYCEKSLIRTPERLAVLKDAGVVDSGGAGLLLILQGYNRYFSGEKAQPLNLNYSAALPTVSDGGEEYGYCTEFLLKLAEDKFDSFKVEDIVAKLESIGGQSIVALCDDGIVKVHVHVQTPGDVLNIAQQYGEFITIKVENMTVQHNKLKAIPEEQPKKQRLKIATVTVACDDGFKNLFYDMGADYVIHGGQSMNPSVEDFIKAFDSVNADCVLVLPNNSNVILTAQQAKGMYKGSEIIVVESKNLAQGYSAISMYNPDESAQENVAQMNGAKGNAVSMEITYAIRNAHLNGVDINKADSIAIVDGAIASAGKDCPGTFASALKKIDLTDKCVITIFCGEDAEKEEMDRMSAHLKANYPDLEMSMLETKQKIYPYIIAIE